MDQKTILILSDIHYGELAQLENFGKSGVPSDEDLQAIANGVFESLDTHVTQKIDYLFILGDLTSRGTPGEFQDFSRFLTFLKEKLDLKDSEVYLTYGNHDVDWTICKIESKSDEHHKAYCVTAANIGGIFAPPGNFKFEGPVIGSGVAYLDGIDLISLNSGIECYDDQKVRHGSLGDAQFEWLEKNLSSMLREDTVKIVIVHHHLLTLPYPNPVTDLSALKEGPNLLDLLGQNGINIVLHGHRHHPIVHTASQTNWKKPITFVCAGSFGVDANHRSSGRLPNMFHVASTCLASKKSILEGYIKTFELNSSSEWGPLYDKPNEYQLNETQWFGQADAMQNATPDVQSIMKNLLSQLSTSEFASLPEYDTLSLSLRCILHSKLNELFQNEAAKSDLQITGVYPDRCIATKV